MRSQTLTVAVACGGALAYTVSKIELAVRGEIGMPGFPAPPAAYEEISAVAAAQFGNAALGLVLVLLTAALLRPPEHTLVRRVLLGLNWLGIAMVGAGVCGFTARASGLAPGLGEPAVGISTWVTLAVGTVWTVSWVVASLGARRTTGVVAGPDHPGPANLSREK